MKKFVSATLIAVSLISSAFAAPGKTAIDYVKKGFDIKFPKVMNVKWELTEEYAKATFISNSVKTEAFYSVSGEFMGTSHVINQEDLPTWTKRILAEKYGGFTVKETLFYEGTEETAYLISVENDTQSVVLKAAGGHIDVFKSTSKK